MGVKGLQSFVERCCPEACVTVNLRDMARQHVTKNQQRCSSNITSPTLVVDGMSCLCHWYSCMNWVCGGQWTEYMEVLKKWVEAFTSAGIKLVFFFDGVVEEQKRPEWVKRRLRVNKDILKIFNHIKQHGEQPGQQFSCLPSALATFTPFALRSLGQDVFCSVREADYEIASYACCHGSMGILGQDTDFIIYDSAPYLSVAKLRINGLTTVMYDRQRLCRNIGLSVTQLPLLACLLGNDVVSEELMQHIRSSAVAAYRRTNPAPYSGPPQGEVVLAVAQFVSSLSASAEEKTGLIPHSLNVASSQRELLKKGICSYLLPGHKDYELVGISVPPSAFEKYVSPEILKACREKHVAAEGFMVYSVVCAGVTECSNSLEDEEDEELLPQALVFKPCRQRIYGLLLLLGKDGSSVDAPAIREWFVFPGNPLKEADTVHPVPINIPCGQPSLDLLWFSSGPEVSALRLAAFLTVFDCLHYSDLHGEIGDSLLAALCLVTYIVLQVETLSEEDVDAYLSQAVCLRLKSPLELWQIELPVLSSRAVQLGSLYVRGLSHLLGANNASGCALPSAALMPWHGFDGRLFHSKYLLAHSGAEKSELLDRDMFCLSQFVQLKEKLLETCRKRGRILQSRPRETQRNLRYSNTSGFPSGADQAWRGETRRDLQHGQTWRQREAACGEQSGYENPETPQWRADHRGGGQSFHSHRSNSYEGQPLNRNRLPKQNRGRLHHNRGRYQLAPRWQHPPAP
ncbi:constitutive coactivator of peroxisome proliferator-activated receptor gamma isoform X1 [Xiphophorus couchianus]|uniref:constitutive coactivator of peroxisome proliferator-activated receptor gamma isoform X1 n=1 Tax=Xiphophorus couchianus TaxID=32473 RepID=UPI0010162279|nr:constitutive coactivator of peroxisome proliferator-activated receptor gamma isoform X1 [Xiphophorus couchianus]